MATCDLHMHSTASDGSDAPAALAALAAAAGLAAIALTDHDTTAGLPQCAAACAAAGIDFVPGIEVSADLSAIKPAGADAAAPVRGTLHLLGLFIRHDDRQLADIHQQMVHAREGRNTQIVQRLCDQGVRIGDDEVQALAAAHGSDVIGRPHIAQVLLNKGYVKSVHEAFVLYLGQGAAAYVRRDRLDPRRAIDAIHHAGGLAILAHPVQLQCTSADELELCIKRLKAMGLDGLETQHCDHTQADVQRLTQLAACYHLLPSGGSDYHGDRKAVALGSQQVSLAVYDALRQAWLARTANACGRL
ncbi:MAG: PHP domain-containing protein [Phycisphaeraceae bacterium]